MKFALELFVPEKLVHAGGNSAPAPKHEAPPETTPNIAEARGVEPAPPQRNARRIIEELDHAQFGGPSFGPQTIELMSAALQAAESTLDEPASDQQFRSTAATLLKVAGDGERDPVRLKAAAMSVLNPVASTADEQPPST